MGVLTIFETPPLTRENKRFPAKIVNFLSGSQMCLMCAQQQNFLSHFEVHQKSYLLVYILYPQHVSSLKHNRSKIGQVQFPPNDHLRSENHI